MAASATESRSRSLVDQWGTGDIKTNNTFHQMDPPTLTPEHMSACDENVPDEVLVEHQTGEITSKPMTLQPSTSQHLDEDETSPTHTKFALLKKLTGDRKHHGHKTFYQHLVNVYTYLKEHGASEEVCDAGLFHSIYGTEFYEFQNSHITREVVRGLIGDYAEELVHIFCTTQDRFNMIVNNTMELSARQARDLCCIEFANIWDQNKGGRYRKQLIMLAEAVTRLEGGGT